MIKKTVMSSPDKNFEYSYRNISNERLQMKRLSQDLVTDSHTKTELRSSSYTIQSTKLAAMVSLIRFNPLNANPEKWSNTLKQIVGNLSTICLSVFDHFTNLALKGLRDHIYLLQLERTFVN